MRSKFVTIVAGTALLCISAVGAQTQTTNPSGAATAAQDRTSQATDYSRSLERLKDAAQRLREAIQAMATEPAGPKRKEAIMEAHRALFATQEAMLELPPGRTDYAVDEETYREATRRLMQAAQMLQDTVQELAPHGGAQTSEAIEKANAALFETQRAMISAMDAQ